MARFQPAALFALALAATAAGPAAAQYPAAPQGKTVQVEFHDKLAKFGGAWVMTFNYEILQGDRFQVEAVPAGGVEAWMSAKALKQTGANEFYPQEESTVTREVKWKTDKGLPGKRAQVQVLCDTLGKVNVRITRLDADGKEYPAAPAAGGAAGGAGDLAARVQRLETAQTELARQNAEIARQLAEIRRLLDQKK